MSASISETGDDRPLEAQKHRAAPIPFTRNRNEDTSNAVIGEIRRDEEHIQGMMKESTVWDVYNNEARKVDNELVKDWTASLNFLLVFAAIFAAVLTAFIIESKKMLEQDPTEILVDIAIQYLNNIGNQSRNNITRPGFEPSFEAISINCLLFASLGASLVAALASVVALQWVADYDAAITRGGSSPEDRAKRRQFRHGGVVGWKMGEIIAALPILLYSSVILFWAGAIQWMWTLHPTVGYVVAGGTAIAVLFYASTTILAAVYVSAPFRTPLSRGLYWAIGPSASTIYRVISWFPVKKILRRVALLFRDARFPSYFRGSAVFQWIEMRFLPGHTSRHREDRAAEQDPSVALDALAWLAQQLPISADSYERLLLCISGIPALTARSAPSPLFHDAPWLAIIEVMSEHLMRQIFDPTSSETDYQGVGILLQCINSPFIRSSVVPAALYVRHPGTLLYWTQCCIEKDGIPYFGATRGTPVSFLLARDVPVPSLGSKYELEATVKLIRWRNSIYDGASRYELCYDDIWLGIFSDIGRYSPSFLRSCLRHFRTWTNVLWSHPSGSSNYTAMFDSIVEKALHRDLTTGEALALARAFAGYLTGSVAPSFSEISDEADITPQPFSYMLAVGLSSESIRATHLAITFIVVRAAKTERLKWAKWITLMLWISIPKEPRYLEVLRRNRSRVDEEKWNVWEEIAMSSTNGPVEGPHVEEIGRILWRVGNPVIESLSRDAFKDPQSLRYLELLLQWAPQYYTRRTDSQRILLYLYQSAPLVTFDARLFTLPIRSEEDKWTIPFNLIVGMLALSDSQDLARLDPSWGIGLECARPIFEIVKAVKRQSIEFLCLLTDLANEKELGLSLMDLAFILDSVMQAMSLQDEKYPAHFLRQLASRIEAFEREVRIVSADAQNVLGILQAKYAARLVSSTAQLRLLSCARSAAVAQPAMGWLGMHVPL